MNTDQEFASLNSWNDWRAHLDAMLQQAQRIGADDLDACLAMNERFDAFILHSTASDGDVDALDRIAREAGRALLMAHVDERLQSLAARRSDLAHLTKRFRQQAALARQAAADLRMQRAVALVDDIAEVTGEINDAVHELESDDAAAFTTAVGTLAALLERLQGELNHAVQHRE
jgi:hypothetical protein